MTNTLADIQADFIDALKQPDTPVPAIIDKRGGHVAKRRFDIYRNNVIAGLTGALRATYPAIETLVGGDFFAASARVYIDRHPPRSPLLFRYGGAFGDFLDEFPPASGTPYLGDVARLEWARLQAYHAKDATPLTIEALSSCLQGSTQVDVDMSTLGLGLHPSVTLLSSRWPIVSLWAASVGLGGSDDVEMKRAERALVIRPSLDVETRLLPESAFTFMAALRDSQTLQEAVVAAMDAAADFSLADHLGGLFALGAVSRIDERAR